MASDKALKKEKIIFEEVLDHLNNFVKEIQCLSDQISQIDLLVNFANIAKKNNYTKPIFNNEPIIDLDSSRHPVIEKKVENFVNNDLLIHQDANMIIITGPNMGGKSTYLRCAALLSILAQCGSFVPAKSSQIGIVDRIFTRVGASDDIRRGRSTFMMEMMEVSHILKNSLNSRLSYSPTAMRFFERNLNARTTFRFLYNSKVSVHFKHLII